MRVSGTYALPQSAYSSAAASGSIYINPAGHLRISIWYHNPNGGSGGTVAIEGMSADGTWTTYTTFLAATTTVDDVHTIYGICFPPVAPTETDTTKYPLRVTFATNSGTLYVRAIGGD